MKQIRQVRQGDILLVAVEIKLPLEVEERNEVILAEGEMTGHAHTLAAPIVYDWQEDGQRYVRVSGGDGELFHQDHDPVAVKVLPSDVTFRVIPQQEWSLKEQWKTVID